MTNPAVYIVTGVVIAVAAVIAVFAASSNKPQATSHGRRGPGNGTRYRPPSPPPSPPRSALRKRERRRRSPERRSNSPVHASANEQLGRNQAPTEMPSNSPARVPTSAIEQHVTCRNCNQSPYIKVNPCGHESLCRGCFSTYLVNNDTCPDCNGRIDSCTPPILLYNKCRNCRKFTKIFKFLDCNHSLSLCIRCFEEQNEGYRVCPTCNEQIRGSVPSYTTSGKCAVCHEFTRFALFQPCGHGRFCQRHASQYLVGSDQECSECGERVTEVV